MSVHKSATPAPTDNIPELDQPTLDEKVCIHGHVGQFYWVNAKSGKVLRCRKCGKESYERFIAKNRGKMRAYSRKANAKKRQKPEYQENQRKLVKEYRLRNPVKMKARRLLQMAVYRGKVVRPNYCSACLTEGKPEGHHDDYSKPLDVQWLCKPCHEIKHHGVAT